jgi:hypothetical protein
MYYHVVLRGISLDTPVLTSVYEYEKRQQQYMVQIGWVGAHFTVGIVTGSHISDL